MRPTWDFFLAAGILASERQYITTHLPLALLHELLGLHQDRTGVKALVRDLLAETTTAFFVGAPGKDQPKSAGVAKSLTCNHTSGVGLSLGAMYQTVKRSARTTDRWTRRHLAAQTSSLVETLHDKHEAGRADVLDDLLVHHVQGGLVDETDIDPFLAKTLDRVE